MNKATPWIVLLVIAAAVAGWYFYQQDAPEEHPSVVSLPVQEIVVPEPEASYPIEEIPVVEEPTPEPLPSLAQSDEAMADALAGLVGSGSLSSYFVLEQLISHIVATVDSLDSRQLAPLVMPVKPVAGAFKVTDGDSLAIHSENDHRYSIYAQIAASLDAQYVVDVYVRFYPLFQQAYSDLGYGDAHFSDRLVAVIDHLLATPKAQGELKLIKPEAVYLFEDPELEALSGGQKLLLRAGTTNAEVMVDKLREIRNILVP